MAKQVFMVGSAMVNDPSVLKGIAQWFSERHGWLRPHKIKHLATFDLLTADLREALAVIVLRASDGSTSHSITVHDNVIFDGNEKTALPLCQENLNFLCSTASRQANYIGLTAGYIYHEHGTQQNLMKSKQSMQGDPWQCHDANRDDGNKHVTV